MNAYYENINVGYDQNTATGARRFGDGFISFICSVVAMVTCPAAVMLEKVAVIFALFLSFFAVVGATERGEMSMLLGIMICAVISLCEYGILRSFWKKNEKKQG